MKSRSSLQFCEARVLDGGMATELECLGADIAGPLWSAHVLEDTPEMILAVHRAYLEAGADVLLTASYQVSRRGYVEYGLSASDADRALLRSVELACAARDQCRRDNVARPILVAVSLGPYGAALHNGAEYHGNYGCTFVELTRFHEERIAVVSESGADLLAFETIPSLAEAEAIGDALKPWPDLAAWFSFTCPSERAERLEVAHGERLRDCAATAAAYAQTVAVGINCTEPVWLPALIAELRRASEKPIVAYPNSGELWDADARCWKGSSDPSDFGGQARAWFAEGAQLVGGCCRTRPDHIRRVAAVSGL